MSNQQLNIVLETKNLSIGYPAKTASFVVCSDINLKMETGSLVALIGQNGIGKSTLLRTIASVQNKLSGEVLLNEQHIDQIPTLELAQKISLVLTERLPESQLSVFELVALGRQPYTNWLDNLSKVDVDKVVWALEMTETFDLKSKRFYELSDGQLQRVLIARALAQDTEIIILDEPTAHLDIHHTIQIFRLLKDLVQKTKKTVLISSHEVNLSIQLADQLLLMTPKGLLSGTSDELIQSNAFNSLFPRDYINFNAELKQFIFEQKK